ncbi:lipid II flippase Amj family protein [Paenibacillus doosanensis]|uniref:Lipid II flippase Amj n=1 Tax=Paenibacillus konkukensis TaxID=2020716 RepID=A0ABY4RW55_9BACL|nr:MULTISPECIES: lipid II flippase Amj family protein [Paenibacillus]MCS7460734.1 lipid II flippase Amj family protein [Paenibacillus doosanensis]UQZ85916.1 hypothetical protein SK3146_05206 [Paenibacillus konkukensis]
MIDKVLWVSALTMVIHAVETLSYGIRLAGVRTGKLAVALSLTGMIVLLSRTSNLIQGPMMGGVIDEAKRNPGISLEAQMHVMIAGASIGTLLAILFFPTAVRISVKLISRLEETGSLPRLVRDSVSIRSLKRVGSQFKLPTWAMLSRLRVGGVPKRLLLLNMLVTGFYTVGVLAALYASFLMPEYSTAASQSSGLVNGIATILMTLLVDPQVALLTDRAMNGQASMGSINKMYGWLMFSRFCGTWLAQLLLVPCTLIIQWIVPLFA